MGKFEKNLGFLITDIGRGLKLLFDTKMKPYGLTRSQWFLLAYVNREEGITQTKLAELLEIGKGSVGGLIDRMEAAGLVIRTSDPKDRRVYLIYLTDTAKSIVADIMVLSGKLNEASLKSISKKDRDKFIEILQIIKMNLAELNNNF